VGFHPEFPSADRAPLPAGHDGQLDVLIVVDAMIAEMYAAGGLATLTEQIFPPTRSPACAVKALTARAS
jgi:hypothetical protein